MPPANIGPRQQRRRRIGGYAAFAVAAVALAWLVSVDAARAWRLLLTLPLWAGSLGVLQASGQT